MKTMNNQEYWERRKARQMYEEMESAERLSRQLLPLYLKASEDIRKQAEKIFTKYQSRYGLSKAEAEVLLKTVKDPADIRRILELLRQNPEKKELLKELEAQAYGARLGQLTNLYNQLDMVVMAICAEQNRRFYDFLSRLTESVYYRSMFDMQQYAGYGFSFKMLDRKNIEDILNTKWHGADYSQRIWNNTKRLSKEIKKEIMLNLLTGRPLRDAAVAIDGKFGSGYNNARRLIRTESNFISNQMQKTAYEASNVKKYIYLAILDLKTSEACRSLDKKRFPVAEAMPGKNYPPMHPWCRSTTIADMPDEWLHEMKQKAIDPATGKRITVPGDMTYQQWYDKYVRGRAGFSKASNSKGIPERQSDLQSMAIDADRVISKYTDATSRWSGKVNPLPEDYPHVAGKEWNCDILAKATANQYHMIHELLHARSISHYDVKTYIQHHAMEELPVEFLARQIAKAEGIPVVYSSSYDNAVISLGKLNRIAGIAENDMEFAKQLFHIPVPQRASWLKGKVDEKLFTGYPEKEILLKEVLKWGL